MKSRWIEHQGKRVFVADYSKLGDNAEAIYSEGQQVIRELSRLPQHSAWVIIDVHNTHASVANSGMFKKILSETHHYVLKRAVIGLTPATRHFIETLKRLSGKGSLTPFDSLEKALDWIVQE